MMLLFRADAGAAIGTGHVMRCLALAQAAHDAGHATAFVTAPGNPLENKLRKEGCTVLHLSSSPGSSSDARETASLARRHKADWIVVDGYGFGSAYQAAVKEGGASLLFVDDFGHGSPYRADLILNQNSYASRDPAPYAERPASSRLLLGCSYALLRREFRTFPRPERRFASLPPSVLVTLGGGDAGNATAGVVEALGTMGEARGKVTVVVGGANPRREQIRAAAGGMNITVDTEEMPALMAAADMAVAAGGTTAYELAYMGVPSLLLTLTENQRRVAEDLQERGIALALGEPRECLPSRFIRDLAGFLGDREQRQRFSRNGQALVDGRGAERVLRAMATPAGTGAQTLRLRPAATEDCRLLWEWANDPVVRASAFSTDPIPWESHVRWFQGKLRDRNCTMFLALDANDAPVGQIRFDLRDGGEADVDVHLAPGHRGKGLGTALIAAGVRAFVSAQPATVIHAYIKEDNTASLRAFVAAGFSPEGKANREGCVALHCLWRR